MCDTQHLHWAVLEVDKLRSCYPLSLVSPKSYSRLSGGDSLDLRDRGNGQVFKVASVNLCNSWMPKPGDDLVVKVVVFRRNRSVAQAVRRELELMWRWGLGWRRHNE
jgi:hypothetical protein